MFPPGNILIHYIHMHADTILVKCLPTATNTFHRCASSNRIFDYYFLQIKVKIDDLEMQLWNNRRHIVLFGSKLIVHNFWWTFIINTIARFKKNNNNNNIASIQFCRIDGCLYSQRLSVLPNLVHIVNEFMRRQPKKITSTNSCNFLYHYPIQCLVYESIRYKLTGEMKEITAEIKKNYL